MRKLLFFLSFIVVANIGYCQTLSSYTFNAFSCQYDSLTTTFQTLSGGTPGGGGSYDDCYYNSIPIGFSFDYCGTYYTSLSASSNCWVVMGQTLPFSSSLVVNTYDDDLANTTYTAGIGGFNLPRPIIAPLWIDVVTTGPNLRYATLGTAPNRKFVLEWSNCGFYNFSGSYPPHISVELILYESSNIIDFAYNFISSGASNTGREAIGITDGSGAYAVTGAQNYWSLNNASSAPTPSMTTNTTSISTLPASNQVYRWSFECYGISVGTIVPSISNGCTSYSSTLNLDGCNTSSGYGISYKWQSSPDSLSWTTVSGATIDSYVTTVTANIYYRCIVTCFNSGFSDTSAGVLLQLNTPPGSISGPTIVCAGSTIALTDPTTGGTWSSAATTIATVGSGTGVVTGVSAGSTVITYLLPTGCYSTYAITVNPTPATIGGIKTVCTGYTTTLTETLTGGTWSSSNSSIASVGTTGIVTGNNPGTANITYSLGTTLVCTAIATVTVSPTPSPITGTPIMCVGLSVSLSDPTGGGTWTSTVSTVATVGSSSGVVTGIAGGTSLISYTESTGCAAVVTATVNTLPSTITGLSTLCVGTTTPLFDLGTGTWSSSNTSVATVGSTGIVSGITAGTATITYTLPTGCIATMPITVLPNPPAITGTTTICEGNTSVLSDAISPGTWTSSNYSVANISSITGSTGLLSGITGGTATITYYIPTGCYTTVPVTINPTPATIAGNTHVCVGNTSVLSDAMTGGTWTSSNSAVAGIGSTTGLVNGITPGTSTITYQLPTGCFITTLVTVNPLPLAITGPTTVCAGANILLSDPTIGGVWTSSNSAVAAVISGGLISGIAMGSATITYTIFSTGCFTTTTITVSSAPGPITGTTSICVGGTTTLSNSIGGGTWTSSNTTVASAGFTTGVITGLTGGTTTITYSLGGTCKSTIIVSVSPSPTISGGTVPFCPGATIVLTGSGGGLWSTTYSTASVGLTTGVVTGLSSGTAVITYTSFFTTCMGLKTVTISPLPPAITGVTTVCIGGTTTLSDPATGGVWSSSNTLIATIGTSSGFVTGIAGGTVNITYKSLSTGCAITTTLTVTPAPPAIGGTTAACIGATTTLSDATSGGTWSSSATTIATIGLSTGLVTGVAAGTTTITYIPPSGCPVTTTVTINPFPSSISGITTLCIGATSVLTNTGGGTWSSSNTTVATIGLSTGLVTGIALGTATVTYTLPTGCIITTPVTISPTPRTISGSVNVCTGTTTILSDAITGGTWTSSNTAVATIGFTSGLVTGVSPGTTLITYSLGTGCTTTTTVIVGSGPSPITGTTIICISNSTSLSSTTLGGIWSSSNTSVATIGITTGTATGIAAGTTTITYTKGCITITTLIVSPTPVTIAGASNVCQGSGITLSDAVTGGTWTSSATTVATIGFTSGSVLGLTPGTTLITYSLGSGCAVNKLITVNPVAPITGVTSICTGLTTALSNSVVGGTWSSSNTLVATVGLTSGIVTGVAPGIIAIVYTTPAGCTSTTGITVNSVPLAITGVMKVCAGQTTSLSDATFGGTWTSGSTTIATIGLTSGIVSGISAGTSIITYSLGSGCTVYTTVTVNPSAAIITGTGNLCAGAAITLSNSVSGGAWSSSNTTVATIGITGGLVTGVSAGTAIMSYTLPAGCVATKVITINPLPAPVTGSPTVCVGQTTALSSSPGGGTWSGTPPSVASIGLTSGVVSATAPGVFSCVYTVAGCTVAATVTVVASPAPITGTTTACVGNTITLSDAVTGGIWSSGNTTLATIGAGSGILSPITSGTLLVNYTMGTGCTTYTTVIVNPISPITGSSNVCQGQATMLIDTTLGGAWSSSNTAIATVGIGTGIVTGVLPGAVTITYTTPKGCTATYSMTVIPAPPAIKGNVPVCLGQSIILSDPAIGGTWNSGNTVIATIALSTGVLTGAASGTVLISYTLGGCPSVVTATVNPLPSILPGPTDVCVGSTITLAGSGSGLWNSGGTLVASVGATSGVVTGNRPGTATITYTATTGCVTSAVVTVHALPSGIIGASNLCIGAITNLSDASPGGLWSSSNTTVAIVNSISGDVMGVKAGTSTILYTVAAGCSANITVTVNTTPLPISGGPDVCVGAQITLTDPGSGIWTSSNTTVATIGLTSGVVTGSTAGTAIISYSLGTGCGVATVINVNPVPAAITGPGEVCVGNTVSLADATLSGTWSSAATSIATIDGSGTVTGVTPGTALIAYTLGTGCAANVTMTVTPQPASIIGNTIVCYGSTVTFSDAVAGGTWATSNSAIATVSSTGVVTGVSPGSVSLVYTMGGGCAASVTLSIVPLPTTYIVTGGGSYCAGGAGVLIGLNGSATGTDYFLYKGGKVATGPVSGTGGALDFGLQKVGGVYTVIATNTLTGCSNYMTGSATITVLPSVIPAISLSTGFGDTVCSGVKTLITAGITGGGSTPTYRWNVNGTDVSVTTAYYSFIPANGDVVTCTLTSDSACASPTSVSNSIKMTVVLPQMPSASLSAFPGDTICDGSSVTITPLPVYGGYAPTYTWMVNGSKVSTGPTLTYVPANGDIVKADMTSNYSCLVTTTVPSNNLVMVVDSPLIPHVMITGRPGTSVAPGQYDTLTAVVTNGGATPSYQWLVNGIPVKNGNTNTYISNTFNRQPEDSVTCVVTSSGLCTYTSFAWVYISIHNLGVTTAQNAGGLTVLPNPNKGAFNIKGSLGSTTDEDVTIEITDLLGQSVYRNTLIAKSGIINENVKLNNTLANGMYILSVRSGTGNYVFHIVIEE